MLLLAGNAGWAELTVDGPVLAMLRKAGLRAIGGGGLPFDKPDACDDAEDPRRAVDGGTCELSVPLRRGGGGGGASADSPTGFRGIASLAFFIGSILAASNEGSTAGGSLRPAAMFVVSVAVDEAGDPRRTDTQSGSSDLPNGLEGRFGLSTALWPG